MLTQEQIKNLKEGDPLIVNVSLKRIDEDCDIWITVPGCAARWFPPDCVSLPSEHGTSVPTPKYDPCHLFKTGDVVTPRIYLGRKDKELEMGEKYIVTADEIAGDMVAIKHHFTLRPDIVQTCFLELVTPVEELEPYSVQETMSHDGWQIVRDGLPLAIYDSRRHPNAKAAAEAECARLNAEYRKEQK